MEDKHSTPIPHVCAKPHNKVSSSEDEEAAFAKFMSLAEEERNQGNKDGQEEVVTTTCRRKPNHMKDIRLQRLSEEKAAVVHPCPHATLPGELYYLHHVRTCATNSFGANGGGLHELNMQGTLTNETLDLSCGCWGVRNNGRLGYQNKKCSPLVLSRCCCCWSCCCYFCCCFCCMLYLITYLYGAAKRPPRTM